MNNNITVATLAAAAVDGNSGVMPNTDGRGVQLGINITAVTGSAVPTLTVTIEGQDAASGEFYTLLVSAGLTSAGFTRITVYPGLTAVNNVVATQVLPHNWRVKWAITGTNPAFTATIGASLIQ